MGIFTEHLGPALTHPKASVRGGGVTLLTAVLQLLPSAFLHNEVRLLFNNRWILFRKIILRYIVISSSFARYLYL
jgi:hypothetical protein